MITAAKRSLAWAGITALYLILAPYTVWIALEWTCQRASDLAGHVADWLSDVMPEPVFNAINGAFEWLNQQAGHEASVE